MSNLIASRLSTLTSRQIGLILVLSAAFGYAFLPIFTRYIYSVSDLEPTDIAIWRFIFATPVIWLMIYIRSSFQAPEKRAKLGISPLRLIPLGVLYTGAALSAFVGLQYIPASTYTVLFYTYPALVALISIFLGQSLPQVGWVALVFTLAGTVLTVPDFSFAGENTLLGVAIAFLNALFVAIYFLLVSRLLGKDTSAARGSAWVITITLLTLLCAIPFYGLHIPTTQGFMLLFGLATLSTAMPIFFMTIGIKMIGVTQASIISTVEPLGATVLAVLLLNEAISLVQLIGAILIIAGVLILEIVPRRKQATL